MQFAFAGGEYDAVVRRGPVRRPYFARAELFLADELARSQSGDVEQVDAAASASADFIGNRVACR